jgi:hypothetical protein
VNNCQRCGELVPLGASRCPACGEPTLYPAWTAPDGGPAQSQGYGASGAAPTNGTAWGDASAPPQFSASDLISPDSLPGWITRGQDTPPPAGRQQTPAHSARYQQAQQPPTSAPGWEEPQPSWRSAPLDSLQTVRQPTVGPVSPPQPPPAAYGAPSPGWGQAPQPAQRAQPAYQSPPPPPPTFGAQQAGSVYEANSASAASAGRPPVSAYQGAPGAMYPVVPAQPISPPYGQAAYPQSPAPQSAVPHAPPSAFPGVEQVGMYGATPAPQGPGARDLLSQNALPSWLAGATPAAPQPQPYGMQARSLVDDQSLPEWLRQQPDARQQPTVASWLGASAAEEPAPSWMASAAPNGVSGRGQLEAAPYQAAPYQANAQAAPYAAAPQPGAPYVGGPYVSPPQPGAGWFAQAPVQPGSDEVALPDWLHQQAGAPAESARFDALPHPEAPLPMTEAADPAAWIPGQADAGPIVSAAHSPSWETGSSGGGASGNIGWGAPQPWGDESVAAQADQEWDDMDGRDSPRKVTRGAPLAADEMPSWLRRSKPSPGAGSGHVESGRGRQSGHDRSQQLAERRAAEGWDEKPSPWDEGSANWNGAAGAYRDGADGWNDDAGARSPRRAPDGRDTGLARDDYGPAANAYGRDDWNQGSARPNRDEEWESDQDGGNGHPQYHDDEYDGYGADQGYQVQGREFDQDAGYYGDNEEERSQTGWRRYFRRGE